MANHFRMVRMGDTSNPEQRNKITQGCAIVAGYIGGDTPHVWSNDDWRLPEFRKMKKLPIFVRSQVVGTAGGKADGFLALERLYDLKVPKGTIVCYDRETNDDVDGSIAFASVVDWGGYHHLNYGSVDNIFKHPSPWFVADPTDTPHMYNKEGVEATQYVFDQGGFDYSEVKFWVAETRLKVWA